MVTYTHIITITFFVLRNNRIMIQLDEVRTIINRIKKENSKYSEFGDTVNV